MKLLFDTNVVSYWMGGVPDFKMPIEALLGEFRSPQLFMSVVSLQEILVYSRIHGSAEKDHDFLATRFNFLLFDESSAISAARLAAVVGSPNRPEGRKLGKVAPEAKDVWQRDAAIAGTAETQGLDLLVTSDADFCRTF